MIPELKSYDCADHDPIEGWVPTDDNVSYWLNLAIGVPGACGADNFLVHVATPTGLTEVKQRGQRVGPWPPIVVDPYSFSAVLREVESRLHACAETTWPRTCEALRKQFKWEYEGMRARE